MRVAFDDYVVDLDTRQLLRRGERIPLRLKTYELLSILVTRAPQPVSKDDLMHGLWPDTCVEEGNLASLVAQIRKALGRSKTVIRTVHGFGYAYDGPLSENERLGALASHTSLRQVPVLRLHWEGNQVALGQGTHTIGRHPVCEVVIDSTSVSRHHARIRATEDGVFVEDLRSRNRTRVRGQLLNPGEEVQVRNGDEVQVGAVALEVRMVTSQLVETEPLE